jgi:hypothetical protein
MRRALSVVALAGLLMAMGDSILACGDKFLRMGRNARTNRYVAAYPATVLIYMAPGSVGTQVRDLEKIVKAAGHNTVLISTPRELAEAMASGTAEILLAGPDEASRASGLSVASGPTRRQPDLVPILIRPSKEQIAAAEHAHGCVIAVPADHKNRALAEIDCGMERRLASRSQ